MTWLLTALSLIGVIMNIRLDRRCFYIWTVTNACWSIIDYTRGLYAQSALFAVYCILAVYGVYDWEKREFGRSNA